MTAHKWDCLLFFSPSEPVAVKNPRFLALLGAMAWICDLPPAFLPTGPSAPSVHMSTHLFQNKPWDSKEVLDTDCSGTVCATAPHLDTRTSPMVRGGWYQTNASRTASIVPSADSSTLQATGPLGGRDTNSLSASAATSSIQSYRIVSSARISFTDAHAADTWQHRGFLFSQLLCAFLHRRQHNCSVRRFSGFLLFGFARAHHVYI